MVEGGKTDVFRMQIEMIRKPSVRPHSLSQLQVLFNKTCGPGGHWWRLIARLLKLSLPWLQSFLVLLQLQSFLLVSWWWGGAAFLLRASYKLASLRICPQLFPPLRVDCAPADILPSSANPQISSGSSRLNQSTDSYLPEFPDTCNSRCSELSSPSFFPIGSSSFRV